MSPLKRLPNPNCHLGPNPKNDFSHSSFKEGLCLAGSAAAAWREDGEVRTYQIFLL